MRTNLIGFRKSAIRMVMARRCAGITIMLLLSLMALPVVGAPLVVGKVSFARGSNAAQQAGEAPRVLGKDAEIYQGDNIQTAERSFVIIEFVDGAKVTVRPNSNFSIDQYQLQSVSPQARLALYKGGVRAESGEIAKQDPDSFQIKTETATVKAQQADYSVRVCNDDCGEDNQAQANGQTTENITEQAAVQANARSSVVARVADIKGEVYAVNPTDAGKDANGRRLTVGAPLYSEDSVRSTKDSYVLMVFKDGEKITLQADSQMSIADYHYQQQGEKDRSLYRLISGGMRVLTGSIGKTNKDAFAVDTPVGTIGIRGTGFDLSCVGSCINSHPQQQDMQKGKADGLYSHVWQGEISITNDAGEFVLALQGSNYIANRGSEAIELKGLPEQLINNPFPRPDLDRSNLQKLFSAVLQKGTAQGLYVAVHKGHVQLAKNTPTAGGDSKIDLGKGEVAHVGKQELVRLDAQKDFQEQDPYLANTDNKRQHHQGVYSELLDGNEANTDDGNYQCTNE